MTIFSFYSCPLWCVRKFSSKQSYANGLIFVLFCMDETPTSRSHVVNASVLMGHRLIFLWYYEIVYNETDGSKEEYCY